PEPAGNVVISRQIADSIEEFITSIGSDFSQAAAAFRGLMQEGTVGGVDKSQVRSLLYNFAIVVVLTLVAFFILRRIAAWFYARSNRWVTGGRVPAATDADADAVANAVTNAVTDQAVSARPAARTSFLRS